MPVGPAPGAIAVDPRSNRIYVVCDGDHQNGRLAVIDGATDAVIAQPRLGIAASGVGVDESSGAVYVADAATDAVTLLDGIDWDVRLTVPVGLGPRGVAVSSRTHRVYVANTADGTVSILDGAQSRMVDVVPVGLAPKDVRLDPVTDWVWVAYAGSPRAGASPGLGLLDGASGVEVWRTPLRDAPLALAVDLQRHRAYVVTEDGSVQAFRSPS